MCSQVDMDTGYAHELFPNFVGDSRNSIIITGTVVWFLLTFVFVCVVFFSHHKCVLAVAASFYFLFVCSQISNIIQAEVVTEPWAQN